LAHEDDGHVQVLLARWRLMAEDLRVGWHYDPLDIRRVYEPHRAFRDLDLRAVGVASERHHVTGHEDLVGVMARHPLGMVRLVTLQPPVDQTFAVLSNGQLLTDVHGATDA
jgi:hypothetical protein